jgi:transposase-like protein
MTKREAMREQMVRLVERFESSGQTGAAFCRRHGLHPQRLSYWRRVLGRRAARSRGTPKAAAFTPVRVVAPEGLALGGGVEVTLVGGERLVVRPGTPMELVRSVVEVLRERC